MQDPPPAAAGGKIASVLPLFLDTASRERPPRCTTHRRGAIWKTIQRLCDFGCLFRFRKPLMTARQFRHNASSTATGEQDTSQVCRLPAFACRPHNDLSTLANIKPLLHLWTGPPTHRVLPSLSCMILDVAASVCSVYILIRPVGRCASRASKSYLQLARCAACSLAAGCLFQTRSQALSQNCYSTSQSFFALTSPGHTRQ